MSATTHVEREERTRDFMADLTATLGGVLLIMASCMSFLQGASAIANDDLYSQGSDYTYRLNMTTWGWIHVALGVLCLVVAIGILMRTSWGQVTGMIVAGLSVLANFAFLPVYPWWAVIVIAFDLVVLWALSVQLRNYA